MVKHFSLGRNRYILLDGRNVLPKKTGGMISGTVNTFDGRPVSMRDVGRAFGDVGRDMIGRGMVGRGTSAFSNSVVSKKPLVFRK